MSKPAVMPREKRIERKAQVLQMRAAGLSTQSIITRTGLTRKRVLDIIASELRSKGAFQKEIQHQMWDFDEDARRREFAKRAAQGARAALEMAQMQ